jgi:hypothetical protein
MSEYPAVSEVISLGSRSVLFSRNPPSKNSKSLSMPGTTARGMADQVVDDVVEV